MSGTQPQPPPVEVRVANIGLIGALGAAIIAALIAGIFAVWTTRSASSGETDRSRAEFLRGQRQSLYATVLTHDHELYQRELSLRDALFRANDTTSNAPLGSDVLEPLNKLRAQLDKSRDVETQDSGQIQVLASNATVRSYQALVDCHRRIFFWVVNSQVKMQRFPEFGRLDSDTWNVKVNALHSALNAFLSSARKDLGAAG